MSDGLTGKRWSWTSRLKAEQATKMCRSPSNDCMCRLGGQLPGMGLDVLSY